MRELKIWIETGGRQIAVGHISGNGSGDAVFQYAAEYLSDPDASAISIGLPLQTVPFPAEKTRIFFDGLLPEGFLRRTVAQRIHSDTDDYLSILSGLGRECLGAVRISDDSEPTPTPCYKPISDREVAALAREGATRSAEIVTRTHLSLTGASGKVGLYYEPDAQQWYLPGGTAPSTHIVKQSHIRLGGIVTNEQLSLLTAKKMGIEVPESFIINRGEGRDGDVLFATKRYDRIISRECLRIGKFPVPRRLHQEDFSQALGIPAAEKYETVPRNYLGQMFSLLRNHSTEPIRDQLKLWDAVIFNLLIGNTDAHLKNISLLYSEKLRAVHLAPIYDVVSTVVYPSATRDMAVYIGHERDLDRIHRDTLREAAHAAGIGERIAMRRVDELSDQFESALASASDELTAQGFADAPHFAEQILARSGYRNL